MTPPTLCLNMIVKNESKIIKRMLDSVYSIIDCYCICDTGSSDDTIEIINAYFEEKGISGKIVHEPFQNFQYNRNVALANCLGMSDYILLMDADMILKINSKFNKNDLVNFDCAHILQGNETFYYNNVRIIKNDNLSKYIGFTHEYLSTPDGIKTKLYRINELFISDIGDGGSKSNKFERDVKLLKMSLENEPNNPRTHFYLGNSYFDAGLFDQAIEWYEKRVLLGAWEQEIWYSYYRLGQIYYDKKTFHKAIEYWLQATEIVPFRIENFYNIINHYQKENKFEIAETFYSSALDILKKPCDRDIFLFYQKDVYEMKIYVLYLSFAYKLRYPNVKRISDAIVKVSKTDNDSLYKYLSTFFKKYNLTLKAKSYKSITNKLIGDNDKHFISSSSSIIINPFKPNSYLCNLRMVNYKIENDGSYTEFNSSNLFSNVNPVITVNKYIEFDDTFQETTSKLFVTEVIKNNYIVGLEDLRLHHDKLTNKIVYLATTMHSISQIGMVYGEYNTEKNVLEKREVYNPSKAGTPEKNWTFCDYKNKTHIVYQWYPLQIYEIINNITQFVCERQLPRIFNNVRGSTSAFNYINEKGENEFWFIVHTVVYTKPRDYFHMFCVFDNEMNLKRYSAPFKFMNTNIEYCLSLIIKNKDVILSFSMKDNNSIIGIYDKNYIDEITCYTD